jgi:hypothetical protein
VQTAAKFNAGIRKEKKGTGTINDAKREPKMYLSPFSLDHYLKGLSLGGSRPLPELFEATGLAFDFTDKTIAPLMRNVKEALAELAG